MVNAVRKGGIVAFSINEKLLDPKTDKGTGYSNTIQKLIDTGVWKPLNEFDFDEEQAAVPNFAQ